MQHSALLPSAVACCFLACSSPASNERTIQQFMGSIVFSPPDDVATGYFDKDARFTLQTQGTVDASATVSPMSDLKFRLAVKLEGGNPVLPGEPALPPTLTARWARRGPTGCSSTPSRGSPCSQVLRPFR